MADHPFRVLWIDTGTAGIRATTPWVLSWEYYNGSVYEGVANVADNTNAFTADPGLNTVTWDMPTDMATTTVDGTAGYVVRARVTDAGAGTVTQPLATQAYYDIGLLWVFTESLAPNTAIAHDPHLGGARNTPVTALHPAPTPHV